MVDDVVELVVVVVDDDVVEVGRVVVVGRTVVGADVTVDELVGVVTVVDVELVGAGGSPRPLRIAQEMPAPTMRMAATITQTQPGIPPCGAPPFDGPAAGPVPTGTPAAVGMTCVGSPPGGPAGGSGVGDMALVGSSPTEGNRSSGSGVTARR